MVTLETTNLSKIDSAHGLSEDELNSKKPKIKDYLDKIHARKQGFHEVIDNNSVVKKINKFANEVKGKYEHFVVLGIGGSALGTTCLKYVFYPRSNLYVVDNIDPTLINDIENLIDFKKTLFMVVTKSGGTPETLSQYFYFRNKCDKKGLDGKNHFVFITDPEKGLLRKIANEEGIPAFDVPPNVGGRFSVLTPVALLPAKLMGIDIEKLLTGGKNMRDKFLSENFEDNLPFRLATIQHSLDKKGKTMNVMMPYSQRLYQFANWYRQLLAESIGKKLDNNGNEVYTGLTPINAVGVTDQHSQSQLYNEGPNDKLIIFIEIENLGPEIKIPNLKPEAEEVKFLKDITFNKLMQTEKEGTEQALTKNNRPNITIKVDSITEKSLGELFMLFEGSVAFLGEFYNINAFDQPGVELSKTFTKELLLK